MTGAAARLPVIQSLWAAPGALGPPRDSLSESYGGSLRLPTRRDRPTVVVNFVSTLDGVVSYATPEAAGGGEVSGFFAADRFVMGLLRAHADAVLIGAGTVRAAPEERWTPEHVYPRAAEEFALLRRARGLAPQPATVVATRSGELEMSHPGLADPGVPVIVAGPWRIGAAPHVEFIAADSVASIIANLGARGMRTVLCEGGPHLLGQLVAADLVDELFLTLAPQLAGRDADHSRLALVEGVAFHVADAPWWQLLTVSRAGDHLFLRYRRLAYPVISAAHNMREEHSSTR